MNWLKRFSTFCFLDSHQYPSRYDWMAGAWIRDLYQSSDPRALDGLQVFLDQKKRWLFGHLAYEVSTAEKHLVSQRQDALHFPDLLFFEPQILLQFKERTLTIEAPDPEQVFGELDRCAATKPDPVPSLPPIEHTIPRSEYRAILDQLRQHLQRGDCYEINFCQEFFIRNAVVDPFSLFHELCHRSPNPFSGCYRLEDKWLLCASPERFIKKEQRQLISQPIKGTLQRHSDGHRVAAERQALFQSQKDRAENVMVVDLVRNDLSRICEEGSVTVDELFGIYSFPQVHQMISTIRGTLTQGRTFKDIIDATFPMGSMTGAPKIKVMQLIDQYEKSKRGIFSGALGYIDPGGDFDLNVVIRSIVYNQTTRYLSFQAGGGITIYSDPEKEWEESLLKAAAIKELLGR